MHHQLALGTVQFGQPYGVANTSGAAVSAPEVAAILRRAHQAGLDTLDTAIAYGRSESCLGEIGVSSWRVITKLPPLPVDVADVSNWVDAQVRGSLERLAVRHLDGLLLHKSADLLGPKSQSYRDALARIKSKGDVRAVGVSIYSPAELQALWPSWRPDIVQSPCNVLDQRLIRSGWLDQLRLHGVRVHVRSAFLQGLLLMPPERRPVRFARWRAVLDRWLDWCLQHEVSPLRAALAFVQTQPGIERVVVGVDSTIQLEEILQAAQTSGPCPPDDLFSDDVELIEPSRWKLP